jgi:hypothetical protein
MRSLAAARDWQEKLDVQGAFFSANLARIQNVLTRYMALTNTMTTDLLVTGTAELKKTARAA